MHVPRTSAAAGYRMMLHTALCTATGMHCILHCHMPVCHGVLGTSVYTENDCGALTGLAEPHPPYTMKDTVLVTAKIHIFNGETMYL
jgi:hypothetical protein